MATKKTENHGAEAAIGVALAAAAAAGVYFFYGSKDAPKNRKALKGWTVKAKGEVLEKLEQVKGELTEENYHKIVDSVVGKYNSVKEDRAADVALLMKDLKSHWKDIKKHVGGVAKSAKKTVKKVVKKGIK